MTSENKEKGIDATQVSSKESDADALMEQPIEEAEKNLSRHSTSDSRPSAGEQERTSVQTGVQQSARETKTD